MTSETAQDVALNTESISAAHEVLRGERGRFLPGASPKSPGRPRKGRSVLDATQELAERKWKRIAEAAIQRLERDDAVGNRAWADYRDTFHGIPKQTLVVENADAPALAWLQALASGQGVDGTARELPEATSEHPADE